MKQTWTSARLWIALAAACLMLVQSVAVGFAATKHPTVDAFGNPLCITGTDHGKPDGDHGKLPGCCSLGCGAFVSAFALPKDESGLAIAFRSVLAWHSIAPVAFFVDSDDHDPGSPRAPPALV